jgi:DNA-binding CsgD family transcriptional regulator
VRHPERVSQLILFGSYIQGGLMDDGGVISHQEVEALHELISVGWGEDRAAFRQIFVNLLMPEASKEQQDWLSELQRRTVSPETAARLWRAFNEVDIADHARQVQAPTLVFHVRGDCMVPFDEGRRLAALIPNARFVPLEGKNHILRDTEPAWSHFLTELYSFLDSTPPDPKSNGAQRPFADLTPREHEVLELIAQGLDNEAIAESLVVAPKTVRNHVTRIYSKLMVDSRAQAIVRAREAGYGVNNQPVRVRD